MAEPEFSGRIAVITGAARGLGRAIATTLIERGATVCLLDVLAHEVEATSEALGDSAHAFATDCTDEAALRDTRDAIARRFGRVDVVINNAGGWKHSNIRDLTVEMWDAAFDMNAKSMFLTTRTFIDDLVASEGRVVCIVSIDAYQKKPTVPDYAAAKAAVASLVKTFAYELGPHQVLVNGVAPGSIATETAKQQDWLAKSTERIPIGRVAEPEDIAEVVLFLASRRNRIVTGETIIASGGEMML